MAPARSTLPATWSSASGFTSKQALSLSPKAQLRKRVEPFSFAKPAMRNPGRAPLPPCWYHHSARKTKSKPPCRSKRNPGRAPHFRPATPLPTDGFAWRKLRCVSQRFRCPAVRYPGFSNPSQPPAPHLTSNHHHYSAHCSAAQSPSSANKSPYSRSAHPYAPY